MALLAATGAGAGTHVVQPGDTLIRVAEAQLRPGVGWPRLQRYNRVADPMRLVPGSTLRWPDEWDRERPAKAEVLQVQGLVWRERGGVREALVAGAAVGDGDVLVSDAQASAVLRFVDGTRSLLRGDSRLSLLELRAVATGGGRSRLQLDQGALETQVPPQPGASRGRAAPARFELRSPLAHLGVRGTQFRSRRAGDGLQLEVLEGHVAAREPRRGEQAVAAGQGWQPGSGREALLPPPDLAALQGRVLQRLPLQLAWTGQSGAQAWQLDWWSADGGRLLFSAVTEQPQFRSGGAEIPDGDYLLRLRARSGSGLQGREAEARLTVYARPEPPLLQAPAPEARVYAETLDFQWARPLDAASFVLQLAEDPEFKRLRAEQGPLDQPSARASLPVGVSYWRVASRRADGRVGPWGDAQRLERLAPPPSPPPPEPQRDGNLLRLRWAASELPGAAYQLQLARTPDFAEPWHDQRLDSPAAELELQHSGAQYLRLRTLAPDGTPGPWGGTQQIEGRSSRVWWLLGLPLLLLL